MTHTDDAHLEQDRAEYLERILNSDATRKLIVAGPGTGKTYTFEKVIETVAPPRLVLTFLNKLASDLSDKLGEKAFVHTFHGFAKWVLHTRRVDGISTNAHYYPPLDLLIQEDLRIAEGISLSMQELGSLFRDLAQEPGLDHALRSGTYYDAVGYDDSVYRVLRTLEADGQKIPRYQQILVDEFQDFSALEVAFIEVLASKSPVLVVGDDDQALYAFRDATPAQIRALAGHDDYELFELPYCTRCTQVIVDATQSVVGRAQSVGLLEERLNKQFVCYIPAKRDDSQEFPKIIHADCSTQTSRTPYMARYIAGKIREIDHVDILGSHEDGRPTVLIIGPNPFLSHIEKTLRLEFSRVMSPERRDLELDPLVAYKLLQEDRESRLAWRVLVQIHKPSNWEETVKMALVDDCELRELLADEFITRHLNLSELIADLRESREIEENQRRMVAGALGIELDAVEQLFAAANDTEEDGDESDPLIVMTSLMGSKGLQADHVFIVGVNDGHLPKINDKPTDEEVCQLLVALTRTRRSCTIVSTRWFADQAKSRSVFLDWLAPHIESRYVDKTFLEAHNF